MSLKQPSLSDDPYAVLGAHRIRRLFLRSGIIAPHFICEEPVFVTARLERYAQVPDAVGRPVHRGGLGVPIVEVAGQEHLEGRRRGESELGHAIDMAEGAVCGWLHFGFHFHVCLFFDFRCKGTAAGAR